MTKLEARLRFRQLIARRARSAGISRYNKSKNSEYQKLVRKLEKLTAEFEAVAGEPAAVLRELVDGLKK